MNSSLQGEEQGGGVLYLPLLPRGLISMLLITWNSTSHSKAKTHTYLESPQDAA